MTLKLFSTSSPYDEVTRAVTELDASVDSALNIFVAKIFCPRQNAGGKGVLKYPCVRSINHHGLTIV